MTVNRLCKRRQTPGVFRMIVHASHQAVLKGKPPSRLFKVIGTGVQHLGKLIFPGNRHQLLPFLLGGRVKGQSQCDRQILVRQLPDPRRDAAGGYGNIPLAEMQSMLIGKNPDKPDQIVIIIQWLSGPHRHHIGHSLTGVLLNLIDLIQHFRSLKIPYKTADGRSAEPAAHPAACLRRDTDRIAVVIPHQHAFDHIAVRQAEQILTGSIQTGPLYFYDLQIRVIIFRFQRFPQAFGNICHLIEA